MSSRLLPPRPPKRWEFLKKCSTVFLDELPRLLVLHGESSAQAACRSMRNWNAAPISLTSTVERIRTTNGSTTAPVGRRREELAVHLVGLSWSLQGCSFVHCELMTAELLVVQLSIKAARANEFRMGALLDDTPIVDDKDSIGPQDGGQTVGDHQSRAASHNVLQCVLEQLLRASIHRRGRFVENEDRCVSKERARNAHPLPLTLGKSHSALTH